MAAVEQRLANLGPWAGGQADLTARWEEIGRACREVSISVCGVIEVARGAPWLRGRDAEIQRLDQLIVQTQAADRNARRNPHNLDAQAWAAQKQQKRSDLRQARQWKRQQVQAWVGFPSSRG